jgi:hypothetical protein
MPRRALTRLKGRETAPLANQYSHVHCQEISLFKLLFIRAPIRPSNWVDRYSEGYCTNDYYLVKKNTLTQPEKRLFLGALKLTSRSLLRSSHHPHSVRRAVPRARPTETFAGERTATGSPPTRSHRRRMRLCRNSGQGCPRVADGGFEQSVSAGRRGPLLAYGRAWGTTLSAARRLLALCGQSRLF